MIKIFLSKIEIRKFDSVGPKLRTVKFCFPEYPHDSFRVPCVILVQWFGPVRSLSYPV